MTARPRLMLRFLLLALTVGVLPAAAQTSDQTQAGGPLIVQRIRSAFVVQPDAKITEVDGRTSTLVGGQAGVLTDDTFLVGGAVYTIANRADDRKMTYGGLVLGWQFLQGRRVSFGVKGLVGAGWATLGDDVTFERGRFFDGRRRPIGATTVRVLDERGFFTAEPQATLQWRILRWLAIDASGGYRAVAGADRFDDRLRGAVGTIGVRFGG